MLDSRRSLELDYSTMDRLGKGPCSQSIYIFFIKVMWGELSEFKNAWEKYDLLNHARGLFGGLSHRACLPLRPALPGVGYPRYQQVWWMGNARMPVAQLTGCACCSRPDLCSPWSYKSPRGMTRMTRPVLACGASALSILWELFFSS